jgi:hypothetical protein
MHERRESMRRCAGQTLPAGIVGVLAQDLDTTRDEQGMRAGGSAEGFQFSETGSDAIHGPERMVGRGEPYDSPVTRIRMVQTEIVFQRPLRNSQALTRAAMTWDTAMDRKMPRVPMPTAQMG